MRHVDFRLLALRMAFFAFIAALAFIAGLCAAGVVTNVSWLAMSLLALALFGLLVGGLWFLFYRWGWLP